MVSADGKFVFVVGESGGDGGGKHRKARKRRAVVAVWNGRKRGTIYPGYCGERDPTRLLIGHGRPIQSLYTPENPGERSRINSFLAQHVLAVFRPRHTCISNENKSSPKSTSGVSPPYPLPHTPNARRIQIPKMMINGVVL